MDGNPAVFFLFLDPWRHAGDDCHGSEGVQRARCRRDREALAVDRHDRDFVKKRNALLITTNRRLQLMKAKIIVAAVAMAMAGSASSAIQNG
ncbi:MAG TPA: hypothetical protein VKA76_00425, partial [Gammaproteobacteria bacterium]|nr:hypothetical protein [Gammaproteobacteria bacterium]